MPQLSQVSRAWVKASATRRCNDADADGVACHCGVGEDNGFGGVDPPEVTGGSVQCVHLVVIAADVDGAGRQSRTLRMPEEADGSTDRSLPSQLLDLSQASWRTRVADQLADHRTVSTM